MSWSLVRGASSKAFLINFSKLALDFSRLGTLVFDGIGALLGTFDSSSSSDDSEHRSGSY